MRQWQRDALSVIREARAHANKTLDKRLHLACSRAIDAMVMEGGQVPSELRIYARQTRQLCEEADMRQSHVTVAQMAE
jgi:hypothetical protein